MIWTVVFLIEYLKLGDWDEDVSKIVVLNLDINEHHKRSWR